jgi:pyridoxamine 5'-phosphate oxidase
MTIKKTTFLEPFEKFNEWFCEAIADKRIYEPTAMSLASVDENSSPSNRMVLLKKHDEKGFCFFTNLGSRKAQEIFKNSAVALCFYWGVQGRQIRIEGVANKIEDFEADEYFATRPRDSQIGAWASKQSNIMENHQDFEKRIKFFDDKFSNQNVLRPEFWSGFRVVPKSFEFWHEGKFRLHNRLIYQKITDGWETKNLYP